MNKKIIPNIITFIRIGLSCALFFLTKFPWIFFTIYLICGISDAADGFTARRFKAETDFGTKLDSVADLVFFSAVIYALLVTADDENKIITIIVVIIVAMLRIMNLIITKLKFKRWGVIHTIGNKIAGITLFIGIPICLLLLSFPLAVVVTVGIIAIIAALEESIILITSKQYHANRKTIFSPIDS